MKQDYQLTNLFNNHRQQLKKKELTEAQPKAIQPDPQVSEDPSRGRPRCEEPTLGPEQAGALVDSLSKDCLNTGDIREFNRMLDKKIASVGTQNSHNPQPSFTNKSFGEMSFNNETSPSQIQNSAKKSSTLEYSNTRLFTGTQFSENKTNIMHTHLGPAMADTWNQKAPNGTLPGSSLHARRDQA